MTFFYYYRDFYVLTDDIYRCFLVSYRISETTTWAGRVVFIWIQSMVPIFQSYPIY